MGFDINDWKASSNDAKTASDFITDTGEEVVITDPDGVGCELSLDYENGAFLVKDANGNVITKVSAEIVLGAIAARHLDLNSVGFEFCEGDDVLVRMHSGGTSTSHLAFMGAENNSMYLFGKESIFLTSPPTPKPGGSWQVNDVGIGLTFGVDGSHVYITTSDGWGRLTDWVVERGEGDVGTYHWVWQKWANGKAECWGYSNSLQTVAVNADWGSLYESSALYATFPSGLFVGRPDHCIPSWECYDYGILSIENFTGLSASRTQTIYLTRPSAATCKGWLRWHAIGRWK